MNVAKRLNKTSEYYFSRKLAQIRKMSEQGLDIINLGIGNPDMQPPQSVVDILRNAAGEYDAHGYQSYKGLPQLRKAYAQWYERMYSVVLDPANEVVPLVGSKEGIFYLSMAYLDPGDKVLVPNVGYPAYKSVALMLDAQVVEYDLNEENDWYPDFDALDKEDLTGVKMMWLNYPNMPTGQPATKELFERAVRFGLEHDILICHDNPYSFILNDKPLSILSVKNARETAVELNSLSKTYNMAGWRMGVLVGARELTEPAFTVLSNVESGIFKPLQLAAIEALKAPQQWLKRQNEEYLTRKKIVFKILDKLGCSYKTGGQGLFVWAATPRGGNSFDFADQLLEKYGVFVAPGGIFGSNGLQFIRVSLCQNQETLNNALARLTQKTFVI